MKARLDMASAGRTRMTGLEKPIRQLSGHEETFSQLEWTLGSRHSCEIDSCLK